MDHVSSWFFTMWPTTGLGSDREVDTASLRPSADVGHNPKSMAISYHGKRSSLARAQCNSLRRGCHLGSRDLHRLANIYRAGETSL